MSVTTPTFRDAGRLLRPDTCQPLRDADAGGKLELAAAGRGNYPGWRLPEEWVPEVRSIGVWDAGKEQSWGLDWHHNEGVEITYLERGRLYFEVEGMKHGVFLKEGDLTITRPWQLHRVGHPNVTASRLHWLILDVGVRRANQEWQWPRWLLSGETELRRLETVLRQNHDPVWRTNADVRRTFEKLSEHLGRTRRDPHDVWLKLHMNEIMLAFGELMLSRDVRLDPALSGSQQTVEMFLVELTRRLGEEWTLDAMAQECGLNRTRFSHYCKQITNKSPAEYLTAMRIEAACEMLRSGHDRSITDIALTCGFTSSQYFATVFRRQTGLSPREFR